MHTHPQHETMQSFGGYSESLVCTHTLNMKQCRASGRDLARNEEFSEIAVINIFFTVLKTKTQLSVGGGPAGKISR